MNTVLLAHAVISAYLEQALWPTIVGLPFGIEPMPRPIITPGHATAASPSGAASAIVAAGAVLAVVLMAGAVALWAHYGTTVFFEMIKSGIAACI
ncbi:MAG: hypothetical protein ABWY18_15160 [Tardiphaga sp.]